MGEDDWIEDIHAKRKAARDQAGAETAERARQERVFEQKAPLLWETLTAEWRRLIERYNAGVEEADRVTIPPVIEPLAFVAEARMVTQPGKATLHVQLTHVITGTTRLNATVGPGGGSYIYELKVEGDELVIQSYDAKTAATRIMKTFFGSIR